MWRIYYSDKTYISNEDCSPYSVERRGDVQVIVQDNKGVGWYTQSGDDYYVWDDRGRGARWWGVDRFGLYSYLKKPGMKCILFGETIENEDFYDIIRMIKEDETLPPKAGYLNKERQP